jgi:hypothetical protein
MTEWLFVSHECWASAAGPLAKRSASVSPSRCSMTRWSIPSWWPIS